jgi:hypothetical protein
MSYRSKDSEQALTAAIDRYNAAWNAHDLDAIVALHAPEMVYIRDGVVVQEWTARGRGLEWDGVDVIPFGDGLIKRKDVYSASGSAKPQAG